MNTTAEEALPAWLQGSFWDRLRRLEDEHQRLQVAHEEARRGVERHSSERTATGNSAQLRAAWERYCEVIAELDQTTAEIENLKTQV